MAIDSHMHINSLLINDIEKEINKINSNDKLEAVINIGLDLDTSKEIINISNNNSKFYSSVGIHPLYVDSQDCNKLYSLADNDKVVAIGEIGLDDTKDNLLLQKAYLIRQIEIANDLGLPIIIHSNNTNDMVIDIFKHNIKPEYNCVFHCFQPDIEILKYIIDNGYYISFAGRLTHPNAKKSLEIAKMVPEDLFLVETDSPYITPEPCNRNLPNESSNIKYTIQKLSLVRDTSYEEIEEITTKNTKRLFKKIR